jgi:hypothetical protein
VQHGVTLSAGNLQKQQLQQDTLGIDGAYLRAVCVVRASAKVAQPFDERFSRSREKPLMALRAAQKATKSS